METYDVIIVGAGPAGISTALHLQQLAPELAVRTLILEKARHPRPKPCAGGLTMDGVTVLQHLGLDVTEVPHAVVKWASLNFRKRGVLVRSPQSPIAFYVFAREELDAWLVQSARERGLSVLEETPVQRVFPAEAGVEVVTPSLTYRAQVVVGADGAHSVVRRACSDARKRFIRALILRMPSSEWYESGRDTNIAYFEFSCITQGVPGYIWDFPLQTRTQPMRSWGIYDTNLIPLKRTQRLQELLAAEMADYGSTLDNYRLEGANIFPFSAHNVFSAPHILLVGDAAGVDVLFGEGISPALGYGRIAARAIAAAFAAGDFSFAHYREQVLRSAMGRVLLRRAWLARILYRLYRPAFQQLLWWRLGWMIRWITEQWLFGWARLEGAIA